MAITNQHKEVNVLQKRKINDKQAIEPSTYDKVWRRQLALGASIRSLSSEPIVFAGKIIRRERKPLVAEEPMDRRRGQADEMADPFGMLGDRKYRKYKSDGDDSGLGDRRHIEQDESAYSRSRDWLSAK